MRTLTATFATIPFLMHILGGCESPGGGSPSDATADATGDAIGGQAEIIGDLGDGAAGLPRGTLFVAWEMPAEATCGTRRIESIVVSVETDGNTRDVAAADCGPDQREGSLTIPDLPIGFHRVKVLGLDEAGNARYRGEGRAEILSESAMTTHSIVLELAPASLRITWVLPGGGRCAASGIAEIEATLVRDPATLAESIGLETAACDEESITFDEIGPLTNYGVMLRTYDVTGRGVATGFSEMFDLFPGEEREITVFVE